MCSYVQCEYMHASVRIRSVSLKILCIISYAKRAPVSSHPVCVAVAFMLFLCALRCAKRVCNGKIVYHLRQINVSSDGRTRAYFEHDTTFTCICAHEYDGCCDISVQWKQLAAEKKRCGIVGVCDCPHSRIRKKHTDA